MLSSRFRKRWKVVYFAILCVIRESVNMDSSGSVHGYEWWWYGVWRCQLWRKMRYELYVESSLLSHWFVICCYICGLLGCVLHAILWDNRHSEDAAGSLNIKAKYLRDGLKTFWYLLNMWQLHRKIRSQIYVASSLMQDVLLCCVAVCLRLCWAYVGSFAWRTLRRKIQCKC